VRWSLWSCISFFFLIWIVFGTRILVRLMEKDKVR